MLLSGIVFAIVAFTYRFQYNYIPPLQFFFVIILFTFLMNYMILRDSAYREQHVKPFIQGEHNSTGKWGSVFLLCSVVFASYAMEYIAIESVVAIYFSASIFCILIDRVNGGASNGYKFMEYMFVLLAIVGVFFILRPPFLFGKLGNAHYIGHWDV
jgi:drug/metabolite transporter (DMT)-like permease